MRVQKAQVLCYCVCFLEAAENKALFTDGSLDDVIVGAAAVSRPLARPCFFDGCRAFFCVDNVKLQSRPTVCSCDSIEPMYKKPIYTENHHRDAHMCCVLKKASLFFSCLAQRPSGLRTEPRSQLSFFQKHTAAIGIIPIFHGH